MTMGPTVPTFLSSALLYLSSSKLVPLSDFVDLFIILDQASSGKERIRVLC
jgi:hypothetical protein